MPNDVFAPHRRLVLIGGAVLALTGCGDLLGPGDPPQLYTLRPVMPPAVPGAKVAWTLSIALPDASADLDSTRIAITRSGTTMDYYANAAWPDNLPPLVQSALVAAFQDSGRIAAVARENDAVRDDYLLMTDIRDFAAHYNDPNGAPTVTVSIVAQMASARGRKVAATRAITRSEAAGANSIDAAVTAFDAAFGAALAEIVNWALTLPPPVEPPP